jgi:hypothetical protein
MQFFAFNLNAILLKALTSYCSSIFFIDEQHFITKI